MSPPVRVLPAVRTSGPPAIWAAFARQGAWKNWVLVSQLFIIALLILANITLAKTEPDIVVVDGEGRSTYVDRSVTSEALLQFLAEQKHQPSNVTVVHFTRAFLQLALAVNSSTIESAWPEALRVMSPGLRAKIAKESVAQKLVETYKVAQVRTELAVREVVLVERTPELLHVRALVERSKARLVDGGALTSDTLQVDLVHRVVPRTPDRPDGLEVAEFRVQAVTPEPGTFDEGVVDEAR